MFKKLLSLLISMVVISLFTSSAFAATNQKETDIQKPIKVIHKEAPAPDEGIIQPLDVPAPWTENTAMHNHTSTHYQALILNTIVTALASKYGGSTSNYINIANSIIAGSYMINNNNVFEHVFYYWQPSYIDPQLPYYIKQYVIHYADSAMTKYIGSTTRYYYSNVTF